MANRNNKRKIDSNGNPIPRKMENGFRNMKRRGVKITKEEYEKIWNDRVNG